MRLKDSLSAAHATPFVRFVAVGPFGLALSAMQYELLYLLNPIGSFRAGSTWFVSSVLGVAWVHALHCHFTFAGTGKGRWRATLGRAYLLYATSITAGSLLMYILVDGLGWWRTPCWLVTTALGSLFNFSLLRRLVGQPGTPRVTMDQMSLGLFSPRTGNPVAFTPDARAASE